MIMPRPNDRDRDRNDAQRRPMNAPLPSSRRRRSSKLSAEKIDYIDYKDLKLLQSFLTENGKILPARLSGVSALQQRKIAEAIKRARTIALLPYVQA
jgi:small subunit ribosomal protein S18